jgi:hypothetical protein
VEKAPPLTAASAPQAVPREAQDGEAELSRSVRVLTGQMLEIPFRGTGWVFLGEKNARRGVNYDSRRLDDEGQSFIFRAQSPGVYYLTFNKQDLVRNYSLNDMVEVTVVEGSPPPSSTPGERSRVVAGPRWPPAVEEAALARGAPEAGTQGAAQNAGSGGPAAARRQADGAPSALSAESAAEDDAKEGGAPAPASGALSALSAEGAAEDAPSLEGGAAAAASPLAYLAQAREELAAGRYEEALRSLDSARDAGEDADDELWWLYGQSFESASPARDIKSALGAYQHILRNFPESVYYKRARDRVAYLNRFYFNLR